MNTFIFFAATMAMASATGEEKLLNDGNNAFTAKMFTEVVKEHEGKSVVMSAFSVLQPLAQLALASVGESHDQLLRAIGLPNDNVTKEVFPKVNSQLRAVKGIELKMANKIYIPLDAEVKEDFAALSKTVFGSEFKNIDFKQQQPAAREINTWVEQQTNNRIKDLVDPNSLTPNTRAVLVNALYFKGTWVKQFDKAATTDRDFHVTKDTTVKVPTMYKKDDFKYTESAELGAKIGVTNMFDSRKARLDNLLKNESGLYVSDAVQKAFIEVNEEGAEAAAANAFQVMYAMALQTYSFVADRPFVFVLNAGPTTLFNGVFQP